MRLERVTFSGFRSLRDLTLELGDLTVITGPNNAGKSFYAGPANILFDYSEFTRAGEPRLAVFAPSKGALDFITKLRQSVTGIRILRPVPHLCRRPAAPGTDVLLGQYGENIPVVADHLRRTKPGAWTSVQEAMAAIVPGLLGIDIVSTEDLQLAVRFEERGVRRAWTSGEVSDGTVQALALTIALFDDRIRILGVEEPENALHPWILREIIRLCTKKPGKQVVLTTHSPVLLDYVPAESVHLMWREDGESRIGKMLDLDDDVRKVWVDGGAGLFELYDSGGIPRATPGDVGNA